MIIIKKIILSWILVITWAFIIFSMSNMNSNESNDSSISTINSAIEKSVDITNQLGITNEHPNDKKINQISTKLNYPFRKVAHASEYFVLSLLIIFALKQSGLKKVYMLTIILSFIYACTDEYHQTFINGRTGQFADVIIDTLGSLTGCAIILLKEKTFLVIVKNN